MKTVLSAEVAQEVCIENPLGAAALKLIYLMISTSGERIAEDVQHEIRLSDIHKISGMKKHDRASLFNSFKQLKATTLIYDNPKKMTVTIGGLVDEAVIDYHCEETGDLLIKWYFSKTFRHMAKQSNHWAIIDQQTVFSLSSKYAIFLFQYITQYVNLNQIISKKFTVAELRSVLGVPEGKVKRFADLNRDIIQYAISEINHISRFKLTATIHKVGRMVESVTIACEVKEKLIEIKTENTQESQPEKRKDTIKEVHESLLDLWFLNPQKMRRDTQDKY